jgi:hypothetical protein
MSTGVRITGWSSGGGRPSPDLEILAVFWRRRMAKIQYKAKIAEARKIRAEWRSHFPTKKIPALSTIRRHLPSPETVGTSEVSGVMTGAGSNGGERSVRLVSSTTGPQLLLSP